MQREEKNILLLSAVLLAPVRGVCVANSNALMFHVTLSRVLHGEFFSPSSSLNSYGTVDANPTISLLFLELLIISQK